MARAPMTPLTFQILLALSREQRHGYSIIKAVREATEGGVSPGTGTFYSALHRMVSEQLIEEMEAPKGVSREDSRRRYYRITRKGRAALEADAERLQLWARQARAELGRS